MDYRGNGKFSLKSAYNAISGFDVNPFPWVDKIWFKGCICKHSLCAWMISEDVLRQITSLLKEE